MRIANNWRARIAHPGGRIIVSRCLRFDDLISDCVANQFTDGVQLELTHDIGAVGFGRLDADVQR